jgi:hypothetical protein
MYPLVIGNDDCIARVYTWEYWKFFLSSKLLSEALPSLLVILIFSHLIN